jgi:hypothetical protein
MQEVPFTPEGSGRLEGEAAPEPAPREDVLRIEEDPEQYAGAPVADHWEVKEDGS